MRERRRLRLIFVGGRDMIVRVFKKVLFRASGTSSYPPHTVIVVFVKCATSRAAVVADTAIWPHVDVIGFRSTESDDDVVADFGFSRRQNPHRGVLTVRAALRDVTSVSAAVVGDGEDERSVVAIATARRRRVVVAWVIHRWLILSVFGRFRTESATSVVGVGRVWSPLAATSAVSKPERTADRQDCYYRRSAQCDAN